MLLTKDDILSAKDLPVEEVKIPEWGGAVRVRTLTGEERDRYEASCVTGAGKNVRVNVVNARAKLVALAVVDADGNRMFSEDEVRMLGKKSSKALERIWNVARRLSGISDEDIKEITEGLEKTQSGDSLSG